jgi:hypothetical protein
MASKRKTKSKACRGTGDLLRYLEGTIIPDTIESGRKETAADLKAGARFLRGAKSWRVGGTSYTRRDFIAYLEESLIPDFEDSGSDGYANDFTEIATALKRC